MSEETTISKLSVPTEISVKLAWLHRDASTLVTEDLVELRYALESMIGDALELKRLVVSEIQAHAGNA